MSYYDSRSEHEKDEFTIYDFYGLLFFVFGFVMVIGVFLAPFVSYEQQFYLFFGLALLGLGLGTLLARQATPKKTKRSEG